MSAQATAVAYLALSGDAPGRQRSACARDGAERYRSLIELLAKAHGGSLTAVRPRGLALRFDTPDSALVCCLDILQRIEAEASLQSLPGIALDVLQGADDERNTSPLAEALASSADPGDLLLSASARSAMAADNGVSLQPVAAGAEQGQPVAAFRVVVSNGNAGPTAAERYRFAGFDLDAGRFELQRDGQPVPLEPLTFDLLLLLVRNAHRTITRDELFRRLWGGRIVSDTALSSQVKLLRRALGDCGREQRLIRTVQGRGFQFLPAVTLLGSDGGSDRDSAVPASPPAPAFTEAPSRPVVAVLPFENLSSDNSGLFFADWLTEDILNALSKHRWINVVARNPAFAFRHSTERLDVIAGQLGASHVVTGSVRKTVDRMRITAEAVEIRSLRRLWSDSFDVEISEIFDFQDEVCGMIASRLANELGVSELQRASRVGRENRGAWELYHLGMAEFYGFSAERNLRAQDFLRMAIRTQPDFAEPYSRLAYAIALEMVYFDGAVSQARLDDALELALRGLELDDRDAQAHFALGRLRLVRQEYDLAIDALEHALDLNPFLAVSHCGLGDSLAYEGRIEESVEHFERAIALSPHDPFRWAFYAYRSLAHLFGGDHETAARVARRAVQVPNAHFSAHANLLSALGHLGDTSQVDAARNALQRVRPDFSIEKARARLFYIKRPEHLDTYLEGLRRAGLR